MRATLKIKKNNVFRYILKKGKYVKGKYIVVHISDKKVIKKQLSNINYLGICVSKKNGNSVNRNKLKRWVREAYKLEEIKLKKNFCIIILLKKNTTVQSANFSVIRGDMQNCFRELDLYESQTE